VIGGGISGLSAAYFLLKKDYVIDLYECSYQLGGLASSFDFGGIIIEKYYHFICGGDEKLIDFADEIGIGEKIKFQSTKAACFYNGKYYPFSTPFDLLKFFPISPISRLRFGFNTAYSKVRKKWEHLDDISAKKWLIRSIGEEAYQVIWHPLLKEKFGEYYDQISASWIWHRIHRVASSRKNIFSKEKMGYFEGGSQTLINAVTQKIQKMGGIIHLNQKVEHIKKSNRGLKVYFDSKKHHEFDKIVLAVPLPVAAEIIKNLDLEFSERLSSIKFIGVICGIFRLHDNITAAFWLNINDPRIAANGLIEYTNMNPLEEIRRDKIVYMPFYLPVGNGRFPEDESILQKDFFKMLKIIKPELSTDCLVDFRVFRSHYAQPICNIGFKDKMPPVKTPIEHLFLLDSTQIYPSDRSLNAMIGLTENMVKKYF